MAHYKAQILKVNILLMWKNHGKYLRLLCWLTCELLNQLPALMSLSFLTTTAWPWNSCFFKIVTKKCIFKAGLGFWTPLTSESQLQPFSTVLQHPFKEWSLLILLHRSFIHWNTFNRAHLIKFIPILLGIWTRWSKQAVCPGVLHLDLQISFMKKCSNLSNFCCMMFAKFEYQII